MSPPSVGGRQNGRIRFGVFEFDPRSGELTKHGIRLKLPEQPSQILAALIEQAGQIVSREELQHRLWPDGTFVDFDHSLNAAVNKLRETLGDSADHPVYIETLARRGYRFLVPVEREADAAPPRRWRRIWIATAAGAALAVMVGMAAWVFIPATPPTVRLRQITTDAEPKSWPIVSDGSRVYFVSELNLRGARLMQVPVSGGRPAPLSIALPGNRAFLQDLSPDKQELLMTAGDIRSPLPFMVERASLWAVRVSDGSARRVGGAQAYSARYSPDGRRIAWSTGEELYIGAAADGSGATEVASMPGWRLDVMSWSAPERIVLSCSDTRRPAPYAWQIAPDGTGFRRILPQWDRPHDMAGFTPDARFMLLVSDGVLWSHPASRWAAANRAGLPAAITFGTPRLFAPARTDDGRWFTLGVVQLGELQRLDLKTGVWHRHLDGISADGVEYSRDGREVAYVRYPERSLWRCRADGSQCLQLADGSLGAYQPHWSADGKIIAFNALSPGKPWRIWLVNADGGNLRPAAPSHGGYQEDPAWTADGHKIIFAAHEVINSPFSLQFLDVESGQVTQMPGGEGLHSVKSSPDRTRLLALTREGRLNTSIVILDPATGQWRHTSEDYAGFPSWAPDNKSIIYVAAEGIRRFRLDTWKAETIAPIDRLPDIVGNLGWPWIGQDHDGAPLLLRNRDVTQVYELQLVQR